MAIRFLCSGCSQPIEIDDEWAGRTVSCPYCRRTITAPSESTLDELTSIPTASPSRMNVPPPAGLEVRQQRAPYDQVPQRRNGCAVASAILAGILLAFVFVSLSTVRSHRDEFVKMAGQNQSSDPSQSMRAMEDFLQKEYGGQLPDWMVKISATFLGAAITWVATLVCAILGLRIAYRRAWAVIALIIVGLTPIFICCGSSFWVMPGK